MTVVLTEQEIKQAVELWVLKTFGVDVSPDDLAFFVSCDGEVIENWDEITIEGEAAEREFEETPK